MARPPRSQDGSSAQTRIEDAFWRLLEQKPLAQITVSELVRQTGCNRATFYYYFQDIEALAEYAIEKSLPRDIPLLAQACFSGASLELVLKPESKLAISRLCLLVGVHGSALLAERVKNALKGMWLDSFEVVRENIDDVSECVMDFMAGGLVNVLGQRRGAAEQDTLEKCLSTIFEVFSKPAVGFAQQYHR